MLSPEDCKDCVILSEKTLFAQIVKRNVTDSLSHLEFPLDLLVLRLKNGQCH